jgi:hypothetical protein
VACSENSDEIAELQNRIDSLQLKVNDSYKPGFGEFMSNIQVHHSKLWFAGINQNWELADFEIHELEETFEAIKKYQFDRDESKMLTVINLPLDSIKSAVADKNPVSFKKSFTLLTNTCNSCHQAVKFEFNKVKIPNSPPFSNQEFNKEK